MVAEPVQELSFCVSPSGKVLRHFASIPHHLSCCLQSLAVSHRWSLTRAVVLSAYSGSSTIFVFWHVRSRVSSRTLRSTIFVFWHVRSRVSSRTLRSTIFVFWHVRSRVSSRTLRSTITVASTPRTLSSTVSCSNTCDLVLPAHSGSSAKSVGQLRSLVERIRDLSVQRVESETASWIVESETASWFVDHDHLSSNESWQIRYWSIEPKFALIVPHPVNVFGKIPCLASGASLMSNFDTQFFPTMVLSFRRYLLDVA